MLRVHSKEYLNFVQDLASSIAQAALQTHADNYKVQEAARKLMQAEAAAAAQRQQPDVRQLLQKTLNSSK